jgi:hypothetical protein
MKQDWKKTSLTNEFTDLTFHYKEYGSLQIAQIQMNQTEKQQLALLSKYKLSTIIKGKIKLFLKRVIDQIMRVSDERVVPFSYKEELKSVDRFNPANRAIINGGLDYYQKEGGGYIVKKT